jgi:hypothetical protein
METLHPLKRNRRNIIKQFRTLPVPNACAYLLLSWICEVPSVDDITREESPQSADVRRDRYVEDILNVIWKWVTRPRTEDELQAVIGLDCSCSDIEQRHLCHKIAESGALRFGAKPCPGWLVVDICLQIAVRADRKNPVLPKKSFDRKSWPRIICDFLPHGDEETLKGVTQWLKCNPSTNDRTQVYDSLGSMIFLMSSLTIPHLLTSWIFFEGFAHIRRAGQLFASRQGALHRREEDEVIEELVENCRALINAISTLVIPLVNQTERRIFHLYDPTELLAGYESVRLVTSRASEVIHLRHRLSNTILQVNCQLGILINKFYLDCKENGTFHSSKTSFRDLAALPEAQLSPLPLASLRLMMMLGPSEMVYKCSAPTCLKTVVDTALRWCKGCFGIRYCSRRCQKRGWTNANVGHRVWCSDIKLLTAVVSNGMSVSNAGSVAFAAYANAEAHAQLIVDHLERLSLMKLQTRNPGVEYRVME